MIEVTDLTPKETIQEAARIADMALLERTQKASAEVAMSNMLPQGEVLIGVAKQTSSCGFGAGPSPSRSEHFGGSTSHGRRLKIPWSLDSNWRKGPVI